MTDYWLKQTKDKPLFPDILWSRPESKAGAGKLSIIGGNSFALGAPGIAYNVATESGSGVVKVLMPEAVKKTVKHMLPDADFAPSNPSGSFSKKAMDEFISIANWSDMTLLAGDFGRNSETAVLLEDFVQKYSGPLTVTQDALDYFRTLPKLILHRKDTTILASLAQLQKLFIYSELMTPITHGMTMQQLVEALHELTLEIPSCVVTVHNESIYVAYDGRVVTQPFDLQVWRVVVAAKSSVFWMQNPNKPLEAVTSSLL